MICSRPGTCDNRSQVRGESECYPDPAFMVGFRGRLFCCLLLLAPEPFSLLPPYGQYAQRENPQRGAAAGIGIVVDDHDLS